MLTTKEKFRVLIIYDLCIRYWNDTAVTLCDNKIEQIKKANTQIKYHLFIKPRYFNILGAQILKASAWDFNSLNPLGCDASSFDAEWYTCALIAESKPAVTRREELGSWTHLHIPLPLNGYEFNVA